MAKTVELPDELFEQLQLIGRHLFTVPEVIERLVARLGDVHGLPPRQEQNGDNPPWDSWRMGQRSIVGMRSPRERGAIIEIEGQRIHANTVADLFKQVFEFLLQRGHEEDIKKLLPYGTSNQRYLIASKPVHPSGRAFFVPVNVGIFYIETHKNYQTAIGHLAEFLEKLGITLRYVG